MSRKCLEGAVYFPFYVWGVCLRYGLGPFETLLCMYWKILGAPPVIYRKYGMHAEAGAKRGVVCNDDEAKESVFNSH
jgi:hypothetical protein